MRLTPKEARVYAALADTLHQWHEKTCPKRYASANSRIHCAFDAGGCTQCGAQNMEPMGRLGRNLYYRCERCGWQDAVPVDDPQAASEAEEDEGRDE